MLADVGMPRSAASKKVANVAAVFVPVVVTVALNASSSVPVAPVTLYAPSVESVRMSPVAASSASMSSLLFVESPTSEPSK